MITLGEVNTTGSHACVGSKKKDTSALTKQKPDPQTQEQRIRVAKAEVWGEIKCGTDRNTSLRVKSTKTYCGTQELAQHFTACKENRLKSNVYA